MKRFFKGDAVLIETYDQLKAEKIIFNPPATIVFWNDGSKTVVKCAKCMEKCKLGSRCYFFNDKNTSDDWKEEAIAIAFANKAFGKEYFKTVEKYIG